VTHDADSRSTIELARSDGRTAALELHAGTVSLTRRIGSDSCCSTSHYEPNGMSRPTPALAAAHPLVISRSHQGDATVDSRPDRPCRESRRGSCRARLVPSRPLALTRYHTIFSPRRLSRQLRQGSLPAVTTHSEALSLMRALLRGSTLSMSRVCPIALRLRAGLRSSSWTAFDVLGVQSVEHGSHARFRSETNVLSGALAHERAFASSARADVARREPPARRARWAAPDPHREIQVAPTRLMTPPLRSFWPKMRAAVGRC